MVAKQILRRLALISAVVCLTTIAPVAIAAAAVDVLVVDLTASGSVLTDVEQAKEVHVVGQGQTQPQGLEELGRAQSAERESNCAAAVPLARSAILQLAEVRAVTSVDVTASLIEAHALIFNCAVRVGDWQVATDHKYFLDRLGAASPPRNISSDDWSKVADVDATTNHFFSTVEFQSRPNVAHIVDYTAGPIDLVPQGEHLVVAVDEQRAKATWFTLTQPAQQLALEEPTATPKIQRIPAAHGAFLDQWKKRQRVDSAELGQSMEKSGAFLAVVGYEHGAIELWGKPLNSRFARRLQQRPGDESASLAASLARWDRQMRTPSRTGLPLLRESPSTEETASQATPWWVYATVAAAVSFGITVVVLDASRSEQQRFRVALP